MGQMCFLKMGQGSTEGPGVADLDHVYAERPIQSGSSVDISEAPAKYIIVDLTGRARTWD